MIFDIIKMSGAKKYVTPVFDPTSISGLALWLDASDAATITLNGGAVSQWNDKSGNGINFIQGVSANRPGWSISDGLQFTSALHRLTNAISINYTINLTGFVAFRCTDTASYATTAGNDTFISHGGWAMQTASSVTWGRFATTKTFVGTRIFTNITQIKTTDRVFRIAANATDIRGSVIGSTTQDHTVAAMTTGGGGSSVIGTFPRGNMVIREILIYSSALSDIDIAQIEAYLQSKWNT